MSHDPRFWWYIILSLERLAGQSWSSLATGITVRLYSKLSFVLLEVSLRAKFTSYFEVCCFIIHPQHTTSTYFVFYYHHYSINQHILHIRSCVWIREYQFLSVQHEPEPSTLRNQPLGQHRRTRPLPSCSGYNNLHV
jgi:hypothetical protein